MAEMTTPATATAVIHGENFRSGVTEDTGEAVEPVLPGWADQEPVPIDQNREPQAVC